MISDKVTGGWQARSHCRLARYDYNSWSGKTEIDGRVKQEYAPGLTKPSCTHGGLPSEVPRPRVIRSRFSGSTYNWSDQSGPSPARERPA
jgi:hypothetical protein